MTQSLGIFTTKAQTMNENNSEANYSDALGS